MDRLDILKKSTNENVKEFSLDGLFTICKVVDVYDGDTFRVVFFKNLNDKEPMKLKVRALGCNAAEMHPLKSNLFREEEMKMACLAKNRLIQLVTDSEMDITNNYDKNEIKNILSKNTKLMFIEFSNFDKYGRVLGTLYSDNTKNKSINQIMIDEKHAVYYDGGKRDKNSLTVD